MVVAAPSRRGQLTDAELHRLAVVVRQRLEFGSLLRGVGTDATDDAVLRLVWRLVEAERERRGA